MRANGKVNERLNERFSARLNVIRWDRVREIERSRVGRHRQDNTGEDASRGIAQPEVSHKGDQAEITQHRTERIKTRQGTGRGRFTHTRNTTPALYVKSSPTSWGSPSQ